jgi:hypothetical protein
VGIEERIDELFAVAPEEFVAARDALANELRSEGDGRGAADVKKLRRPTVAAWAVNQVARRHPRDVEELLSAGDDLREAQRRAMTGKGRTDVHEPTARRRAVVDRLAKLAAELLADAGRGSGTHADEVTDTFLAASVEPAVAELVRRGRLDRERKPSSDLGELFGLPDDDSEPGEEDDDADREARVQAAERDAREARREADRLEKRSEQAQRAASTAQEQADRKTQAAREAEDEAKAARKRADAADQTLDRLRRG